MLESQSKNKCPSCGGQLDYEWNSRRSNHRFERHRCQSCKMPVEFGIDPTIKNQYTQIKEASIEVVNERARSSRRFNRDDTVILICCPNHKCTNPGIDVPRFLQEMLDNRQTHHEYYHFCDGFEPSPKWRKKTPCTESFRVTIDIVLKNNETSGCPS